MNQHLSRFSRLWHAVSSCDFAPVSYALWIRWRGLDLTAQGCEELGLSNDRAKAHAASGGPLLQQVLRSLAIPPGQRVVDLGSGKGGAAITMSNYFCEVLGVELSPDLVKVAERNIYKLGLKNVRFMCDDAARFVEFQKFDCLYMFNPFPQVVMAAVARNLQSARTAHGRPTTVIYKNPVHEQELLATGWRRKMEFTYRDSRPCCVYRAD